MAKQINTPHGTVSQSPTVADKKKNLEKIINRIRLAHRTDHANKGNSTKDVSSKHIDSANHGNQEGNLHFNCLDELLDYFITNIRTEEHTRDSNSFPRTMSYPVMLTSKDAKVLDSNVCNKKYPTTISHTKASKTRPYYIYLKTLNIRLMKPK